MAKLPTLYCDDGTEIVLPHRWVICAHCQGHGTSSAHLGAFTREDMDNQSPGFFEDYIQGVYDKSCNPCDGTGKIAVADTRNMTREQRILWRDQVESLREIRQIERMEREMGA